MPRVFKIRLSFWIMIGGIFFFSFFSFLIYLIRLKFFNKSDRDRVRKGGGVDKYIYHTIFLTACGIDK